MRTWLKKWWVWLLAVGALVVAVLTCRRPRPTMPDVKLPEPVIVDTAPADEYKEDKIEPETEGLVDRINRRHG